MRLLEDEWVGLWVNAAGLAGAGGAVLAYSTTDRDSFEAIERWKGKVEAECSNIPLVLIQTKVDLLSQAVMTR